MTTTIVQNSFLPTQISGCQLWFDAADRTTFTLNGSAVSSWRDKSVNGYSVGQATGGNQPTYATNLLNGLPGIQLSASTYLYQLGSSMPNFASSSSTTVFMVAKNGSSLGGGWNIVNTIWFNGPATLRYHFSFGQNGTNGVTLYANSGFIGQTTVVPLNTNAIIGFTVASSGINIDVNGTLTNYTGASAVSANDSTWFIFGDARGTFVSDVNLYEFIGFSTTLTTAQRQQVEGYLAAKWGLQTSLPSNHPYRYSAYFTNLPYVSTIVSPTNTNQITNASFNPASLPACVLWLDGADTSSMIFSSGTTLSAWKDKSGTGGNATASGSPRSTGTGVVFPATGTTFAFSRSYTSTHTVYIVATPSSASQVYLFGRGSPNSEPSLILNYSGTSLEYYDEPDSGRQTLGSPTTTFIASYIRTFGPGGSVVGRLNGSQAFTEAGPTTEYSSVSWGYLGSANGAVGWYTGTIYEFMIFNTSLTTSQAQQVEGYLAWKWGLVANLPPTHPYKKSSAVFVTQQNLLSILGTKPYNNTMLSGYFNPTSIAGLTLWLDGADTSSMTFSGTNITQWRDKSGQGYNQVGYNNPQYSSLTKGVIFNGTTNYFASATSGGSLRIPTATHCLIAVHSPTTISGNYTGNTSLFRFQGVVGTAVTYIVFPYMFGTTPRGYINSQDSTTTQYDTGVLVENSAANTQNLIVANIASGSQEIYKNGNRQSSGTAFLSNTTSDFFALGCQNWTYINGQQYELYSGTMYEVMVFNTTITTAQRQQVEGYLAWKWGLQGSLPPTHPYKSFPPPP